MNKLLIIKLLIYGALAYFIYLLFLITIQYIPINDEAGFLLIKQEEIKIPYYKISFYGHVYTSIFVICLGFFQFSTTIRKRFSFIHRWFGKFYIFLILFIASPTGLIMAYHANGGLISQISFILLSILWFVFTLMALLKIKIRLFLQHKNFMIRSYALTLSAVSLRLFKFLIVYFFELPPMDTYKIVSILGWTINLAIAELIVYSMRITKSAKI
ncbi:DUF2306 domain-containing protein [Frigoriflavimonas asaccharolytica]|uniref:Uncharacterized protein n=1 Tax=Frigoriflavimonas asaccharolytica TaxID=2735899 RepID=A0A8J8G536_9FLAO|nr:DUF2306 domain-containing protein [Frigoriflavimonas asaccharolytica]NRS91298.1 hypothetical protein [Frigoriflavimonas asaccharolytica]